MASGADSIHHIQRSTQASMLHIRRAGRQQGAGTERARRQRSAAHSHTHIHPVSSPLSTGHRRQAGHSPVVLGKHPMARDSGQRAALTSVVGRGGRGAGRTEAADRVTGSSGHQGPPRSHVTRGPGHRRGFPRRTGPRDGAICGVDAPTLGDLYQQGWRSHRTGRLFSAKLKPVGEHVV